MGNSGPETKKERSSKGTKFTSANIFGHTINGKKQKMELTGQDSFDTIELGETIKFFGVYDGHGEKGREGSDLVKSMINKSVMKDGKYFANSLSSMIQVKKYFDSLFNKIQSQFEKKKNDFELSGSCAVCVLYIEPCLYCINLGDSRAVLGSLKDGRKIASELSSDHKPNRDNESRRIADSGGQVVSKHGGVPRVYKKNDDTPGLAVARSLGDIIGHECGLISTPEIICQELDPDDQFIVIGSDGVWDIMGSSEVVGFVFDKLESRKYNKDQIAQLLVEECRLRWDLLSLFKEKFMNENVQTKSDDSLSYEIDDITAVIFFPWKDFI